MGIKRGNSEIWMKIIGIVNIKGVVKINRVKKSWHKGIRNIYRFIINIINSRLTKQLKLELLRAILIT